MKKIILLIAITIIVFSCNESNFLEENPKDAIYPTTVYKDYNGFLSGKEALLSLIRNVRSEMLSINGEFEAYLWKMGTDDVISNTPLTYSRAMAHYESTQLNPQMSFISNSFKYYYSIVNTSNMIINRASLPTVNWMGTTEEENIQRKNEILAYAYFARGWAYRFLVFGWGAVPISVDEIDGTNYRNDWERDPVDSVKNFIINDFLLAEPYFQDNSNEPTLLSKAVVQHYLAEMYISLYYDSNKQDLKALENAYVYANKVVSNTNYKLITQRYGVNLAKKGVAFMDQFYDGNVRPTQGNTETLWWFPNKPDGKVLGSYNNSMRRGWITSYNLGWKELPICPEWGGRGVEREAINPRVFTLYEPTDARFSEYAVRKYYLRYQKGADGKLGTGAFIDTVWTIVNPSKLPANFKYDKANHNLASTRKWDWSFPEETRWADGPQFNDQTYLRLAESYLLMAEIQMERGNKDLAAFWINRVRNRSNANPVSVADINLDYILDERSRELITEECRRITLARVNKLYERTKALNPQVTLAFPPGMQEFHKLLPIPQSVIDGNTMKLMLNNPGY